MSLIAPVVLRDVVPRSPVFTTLQAAAAASVPPNAASRALRRLEELGLITRLVRGLWADTRHPDFSPYAVVPFLLARSSPADSEIETGYVSFLSALHLHDMLSQIPAAIHVAVGEQRAPIHTPVGDYQFHQLQSELLGGHKAGDAYGRFELATPTKALFDTLYLSACRGRQFSHLPELDLHHVVSDAEMRRWIARIVHAPFRTAVAERWAALRSRRAPSASARSRSDQERQRHRASKR